MTEQPTVKEPITKEPTQTPESANSDILAKLKELDIDTPERLQGVYQASSQVGNMARELGSAREELKAAKDEIMSLKSSFTQRHDQYYDSVDGGLDIEKVVRSTVRGEISNIINEQRETENKARQAQIKESSKIRGDNKYTVLKEVFDNHMAKPSVQERIMYGDTSPYQEYLNIKDRYYSLMDEHYSKIGQKAGTKPEPPHMESGMTQTMPMPNYTDEKRERVKKLTDPDKGWAGTDMDIQNLVSEFLPSDDPFWKT